MRAPRLGPDDRIAPNVTRAGRFRAVDPAETRPLPSLPRLLGAVGWALLLEECLRRAWTRARPGA
ncbi:MAG: hypothetical protein M3N52_05120 [Actinomycetota bacterium]|nr:hypothetical protein [Actinomycetota bacterium]